MGVRPCSRRRGTRQREKDGFSSCCTERTGTHHEASAFCSRWGYVRLRLHLSCPGGAQLGYGSFRLCCGSWVHGSSVHPPPPPTAASAWACVSRAALQAGADWWPDKDQMPPSPTSTAKRDRRQPEGLGGLDPALVTERPSVQPRPHPGSPRSWLQDKSVPASAPYFCNHRPPQTSILKGASGLSLNPLVGRLKLREGEALA